MFKIAFDILIFVALGLALLFGYIQYWDDISNALFDEEVYYTIYVDNVPVTVTVANDTESRARGLSGVESLDKNEGKLFVFDTSAKHGIWMKDMLFPLDIIWVNDDLHVVHFEEEVSPDTFPQVFAPPEEARFVLEVNAFFVDTLRIEVGDRLFIPPEVLPDDIRQDLIEQ